MTIRVGIIGTGLIGTDHGQKLAYAISGSTVSAVADVNRVRAEQVAAELGGARVFDNGFDLIRSDEVDAVLVASIGETHAEFTLACIAAGKAGPVREAPGADHTRVRLDHRGRGGPRKAPGRRRVHAPLRRGLPPGQGEPGRRGHRRGTDPPQRAPQSGGAGVVHQLHDDDRLDDPRDRHHPMAAGRGDHVGPCHPAEAHAEGLPAPPGPQFATFISETGILSTAEFFANCQYGYDVRCELVGSLGIASLLNPVLAGTMTGGQDVAPVPVDWRIRFGAAYHAELQAWITGLRNGEIVGPSAWDGYAATRVTEVGVEAVRTGERLPISYIAKPGIYR